MSMALNPTLGPTAVGLTAATFLAGCTTVRSNHLPLEKVGDKDTWGAATQGLTYFLPARMMKLSATRTPVSLTDLTIALAAKEGELTKAREAGGKADAEALLAKKKRDALPADTPVSDIAKAQQDLNLANAAAAAVKKDLEALQAQAKAIQDTIQSVRLAGVVCTHEAKLELLPAQPDPSARYVARVVHNPFRDDTTTLRVGTNGLLTSGNVIAADRTSDIVVEVAGAIASFAMPGGSMADSPDPEPVVNCASLPKTFIEVFDPAGPTERERVNTGLKNAKFPYQLRLTAPSWATPQPPPAMSAMAGSHRGEKYGRLAEGAIFYRSPVPVTVTLEQETSSTCTDCKWQPVDVAIVMLPQSGPVSFIPLNSSAFVKTVNDVQFVDGSIASWTADRPSEVLEVVRLPVRIATAIISVPAQLLSLRVNYSSQDRALLEAQKAQIQASENLRRLQLCLTAAGQNADAARACVS